MSAAPAGQDALELRELHGIQEMAQAERLQELVWESEGFFDNRDLLLALQHEGALVAGAFLTGAGMVAFIFSFPTRHSHIQHSHRLGVLPEWQGRGLGARLKWFQRQWCLERGVSLVRWTFDPLRTANAWLNIHHLGATSATYLEDYYGTMPGINAGTPSDRILVEWQLDSPSVAALQAGPPADAGFSGAVPLNTLTGLAPAAEILDLDAPRLLVALPLDFPALAQGDLAQALAWRLHIRRLLEHYFGRGYRITGFTRLPGPAYLLTHYTLP